MGLGNCYATLGQASIAIEHYQRALSVYREVGNRTGQPNALVGLGSCYADRGQIPTAIERYTSTIEIANEIGHVLIQCSARVCLAREYLPKGDFEACRTTAEDALAYDYPLAGTQVDLLLGIAELLQDHYFQAQQFFTATVGRANEHRQHSPDSYVAVDSKTLALCGLALTGELDQLPDAIALFHTARTITTAPGIVARTMRLLDAISVKDVSQLLARARSAAQGESDLTSASG